MGGRRVVSERTKTAVVFGVVLGLYQAARIPKTSADEHVQLALAMLHRHLWVAAGVSHELVAVGGRWFTLHPPMSAIVLLPLVAMGMLNQTSASLVVGALDAALAYRLTQSIWLTAFFAFGTVVFYEAPLGTSWGFCLVLSCAFSLLALIELRRGARAWLVGIFAGMAALTRYDLAMVWGIYALVLYRRHRRFRSVAAYLFVVGCFGCLYCAFNYARFGTLTDPLLAIWYATDPARTAGVGPFSIHFLRWNLYTALFMAPPFDARFIFHPYPLGQALILTSPAFILALRAPFTHAPTWLLWSAVAAGMSGALLVYSNGVEQFGARYWIQVFPFLLALMAMRRIDQMGKILIVASIAIVVLGTAQIHGWV